MPKSHPHFTLQPPPFLSPELQTALSLFSSFSHDLNLVMSLLHPTLSFSSPPTNNQQKRRSRPTDWSAAWREASAAAATDNATVASPPPVVVAPPGRREVLRVLLQQAGGACLVDSLDQMTNKSATSEDSTNSPFDDDSLLRQQKTRIDMVNVVPTSYSLINPTTLPMTPPSPFPKSKTTPVAMSPKNLPSSRSTWPDPLNHMDPDHFKDNFSANDLSEHDDEASIHSGWSPRSSRCSLDLSARCVNKPKHLSAINGCGHTSLHSGYDIPPHFDLCMTRQSEDIFNHRSEQSVHSHHDPCVDNPNERCFSNSPETFREVFVDTDGDTVSFGKAALCENEGEYEDYNRSEGFCEDHYEPYSSGDN